MKKIKIRNKNKKRIIRHEQWIEIKVVDGVTVEKRFPSNEAFEKERLKMDPKPDLIYRRLNFVNGIPREYSGIDAPEQMRRYGGLFLQRMDNAGWLEVLERERIYGLTGSTRVIPARRPLARPEELGPCPCQKCKQERELDLPSRFSKLAEPRA